MKAPHITSGIPRLVSKLFCSNGLHSFVVSTILLYPPLVSEQSSRCCSFLLPFVLSFLYASFVLALRVPLIKRDSLSWQNRLHSATNRFTLSFPTMSYAFFPDDLLKIGALAPAGLECTLANTIHPIFSFPEFSAPTSGTWTLDERPMFCCEDAWRRMQPALLLASRLITSPRYSAFWLGLVEAASHPLTYHESGKWVVSLLSPNNESDNERISDVFKVIHDRLVGIGFVQYIPTKLAFCDSETGHTSPRYYIALSDTFFGAYLRHDYWSCLTNTEQLCLHFILARTLTHELAHLFSLAVFQTGLGHEPYMLGVDDPVTAEKAEIGMSWERYLMNNCGLNKRIVGLPPGEDSLEGRSATWGMGLLDYDHDWTEMYKNWAWEAVRGNFEKRVVALPSSCVEKLFKEDWFVEPYPKWEVDLKHLPKAFTFFVWGSGAEKQEVFFSKKAIEEIKRSGDDPRQEKWLRERLEEISDRKLDHIDPRILRGYRSRSRSPERNVEKNYRERSPLGRYQRHRPQRKRHRGKKADQEENDRERPRTRRICSFPCAMS